MKRGRQLLYVAALMYAVAWFVQVIKGGNTLGSGQLPGWEAFRVSLDPIWPIEDMGGDTDPLYFQVLSVASGLSNFVFIGAVLAALRGPASRMLWLAVLVSAVLNMHWFVTMDSPADLRLGYYLWMLSYFVLAAAMRPAAASAGRT